MNSRGGSLGFSSLPRTLPEHSFAQNDRAQPLRRRGEVALDQEIDRVARKPGINHRVALPFLEHTQVDVFGLDLRFQEREVDRIVPAQMWLA